MVSFHMHLLGSLRLQKKGLLHPTNTIPRDYRLSDILIGHYCPAPTKMSLQDFPAMSTNGAQERVRELKTRLLSWDFHPHDLCEDDLMRCVVIVIQEVRSSKDSEI